jgi:hypothetical protein
LSQRTIGLHEQTSIKQGTTPKSSGQRCATGLKSTPALFSGDVVGRANKPEHIGYFSGLGELFLVFGVHGREVGTEEVLKILMCCFSALVFRIEEASDFAEFAGIEPEAATACALIDLDLLPDAEEVPHHYNVITFGAIESFRRVYNDAFISLDVQQRFAGGLVGLVEFLELEIIEPDSSTAALTYVDCDIANLDLL